MAQTLFFSFPSTVSSSKTFAIAYGTSEADQSMNSHREQAPNSLLLFPS
jgi:hypothetical protein